MHNNNNNKFVEFETKGLNENPVGNVHMMNAESK